jgi:hypothetical protein
MDFRLTVEVLGDQDEVLDRDFIVYEIPEDELELEDLMGYIRGDIQAVLEDHMGAS